MATDMISLYRRPVTGNAERTAAEPDRTPVFVSQQALVTFPVASAIVVTLWKVAGTFNTAWATDRFVALLIALAIGALIYAIGFNGKLGRREQAVAIAIGVINSLFLYAAAIGVNLAGLATP